MIVGAVVGAVVAALPTPAQAAPSESPDSVPGFNGTVLAVAYSGSTIYLGGTFTSAVVQGKTVARNRLAAVNAYTGELLPWAPAADGRVKALAVSGSSVYIGGDFGYVSGQKRDSLARLDAASGAVSSTFKHAIDGRPYALAAANGRLYVGGTITRVNGQTRTRLAAFNLTSGVLDSAWKPTVDDQVEALATVSGRVYVGGKFHQVNSTSGYDRLVALDPSSAAIVTAFKPKPAVIVFAIGVTSDGVYTAHGGQGGTATAYSLTGARRWSATFDGDAQAVTTLGDTVYVGGHFDHACRTARTGDQGVCLDGADDRVKLAALAMDDGHLRDWTANMNGVEGVLALASNPSLGAIAAGGAFTTINGVAQKRFAQFS
ncbi:hypothetical protein BG844_35605 [Couchioplanes caeruleus subsp. caeruleus]|uniref:Outer membrane protein assembly factor BamB n=2 Tax=Couchioplanes caeruleus TaxID=56438 RepID=A0A1K0GKV7_9ACTN|nr:hypothetical protein BG844_35605 [Couchioplanes caeruleus subsp. caeruleus]